MAALKLRDRDAILTREGLIFRVFGYSHPPNATVCDAEYASARLFRSDNPKSIRGKEKVTYYKFFEDEGWKFVKNNFPQYMIFHEMLGRKVVGVNHSDVSETRKPENVLAELIEQKPSDKLLIALEAVLQYVTRRSGLRTENFGVFGSLLHGFCHPEFSDIDLTVYGRESLHKLLATLREAYGEDGALLRNEFESKSAVEGKAWRFENYSLKEFMWHQQRKLIYALFIGAQNDRVIKTEFEPVKAWGEVVNEYDLNTRIVEKGWVRILARVKSDLEASFIPSVYEIEPLEVLAGSKEAYEARRVVSYLEEFRMQACKDETVYVEGNLEEGITNKRSLHQVVLTYCPRYYEQVLKVAPSH